MLPQQLGFSRTSLQRDHLFQSPDSFVRAPLPGMQKGNAIVHAGPALGAKFTQYTAELEASGALGKTSAQRFVYVISGTILLDGTSLSGGCFAFIPQGEQHELTASENSRLIVIEKSYKTLGDLRHVRVTGNAASVKGQPLMGDNDVTVQSLLPESPEFDFAVNLMTFTPGAALGMVETHIMEHGLMMLAGGGIYRLGEHWYSAMAGDFIWMAPYCPQWFGAIGKTPAQYLIYKDWNRHPL